MKLLLFIIAFLLFSSVERKSITSIQKSVQKDFDLWNKSTIQSVKNQLAYERDPSVSKTLKNRLEVIQSSLYAPTEANDKGAPSRYKFLNAINVNRKVSGDVFIVESESEGEVLLLRNYLIENKANASHVMVYCYFKKDWVKVRDTSISRLDLKAVLSTEVMSTNKLTGINDSDVIFSEFTSTKICSHYFIPMSINKGNVIRKVLAL
jgi:hypothetical protein